MPHYAQTKQTRSHAINDLFFECKFTAMHLSTNQITILEFTFKNFKAQRIKQMALNSTLERASSIDRIITLVCNEFLGLRREGKTNSLLS